MTAVVTGASRGIGRAIAAALATEGMDLLLTARGGEALDGVARELGADRVAADLTAPDGVGRVAEAALARFDGPPDILVNNAGAFHLAPLSELEPQILDRLLWLNLRAPVLLSRAFLPGMLARGSGYLIHIGSLAGRQALPENSAYAVTKYGLRGLHEVLRVELQGSGVSSLLIEPGPVNTEAWTPMEARLGRDLPARGAMLAPETVADAVLSVLRLGARGARSDLVVLPR
ncbi:MAG: SDR family oxidoreductase [Gemmatimonadota bacterium]